MEELIAIQTELKAPKSQTNNFGHYNYRSCEDILEAVKPLLKKYDCELILSDEVVMVGARIYVKATAEIHSKSDNRKVTAYAREAEVKKGMDDSQITGAASSYARKYALNGLFLIDDNKDSDTNEYNNQTNSAASKNQVEPSNEVRCPECGIIIKSQKDKHEIVRSPQEILKMCGGVCVACYKKREFNG
jgi:hypothetical protein